MFPMLSGLFIKGHSGWIVLAHKTISVRLNYIEGSFPNGTNRKKLCRKCFDETSFIFIILSFLFHKRISDCLMPWLQSGVML